MRKKIFFSLSLFIFGARLFAYQPTFYYDIDATLRGMDIYNAFLAAVAGGPTLYSASAPTTTQEVAIQTWSLNISTLYGQTIPNYIASGVISNVQSLVPATNFTLFIAGYYPASENPFVVQYLVVGVEQITDIFYTSYNSNVTPSIPTTGFTSTFAASVLPYYNINASNRATDIAYIVSQLIAPGGTYLNQYPTSQVWIQTTLSGPFYPTVKNGFIPDIQSISTVGDSLLLILYLTPLQNNIGSVIISSEQVQQIYFYPTNPT